jgi:hypothetical protein
MVIRLLSTSLVPPVTSHQPPKRGSGSLVRASFEL